MYIATYILLQNDSLIAHSISSDTYLDLCKKTFLYEKELLLDKTVVHFICFVCSISRDNHVVCTLANSDSISSLRDDLNCRRLSLLLSLALDSDMPEVYKNRIRELL